MFCKIPLSILILSRMSISISQYIYKYTCEVYVNLFFYKIFVLSEWPGVTLASACHLGRRVSTKEISRRDIFLVFLQYITRCQKVKSRREREIWNPYIVFLVREENKNFCKKKSAIFSYFQKIKRNFKNKSHDLRGDQDFENSNFS